mmetsp:Transcript_7680/g.22456  ORF Transcript_7680/g.22456 Transcript_7680/m.22456 type:complete len:238 (-) Transcript_7680:44-757(-)
MACATRLSSLRHKPSATWACRHLTSPLLVSPATPLLRMIERTGCASYSSRSFGSTSARLMSRCAELALSSDASSPASPRTRSLNSTTAPLASHSSMPCTRCGQLSRKSPASSGWPPRPCLLRPVGSSARACGNPYLQRFPTVSIADTGCWSCRSSMHRLSSTVGKRESFVRDASPSATAGSDTTACSGDVTSDIIRAPVFTGFLARRRIACGPVLTDDTASKDTRHIICLTPVAKAV